MPFPVTPLLHQWPRGSRAALGVENRMKETEHKNVQLDFATLVALFFVVGFGCGVLLVPFMLSDFFKEGVWLGLVLIAITPVINGIGAVAILFLGYPAYALFSHARAGYTVRLIYAGNTKQNGSASKRTRRPTTRSSRRRR